MDDDAAAGCASFSAQQLARLSGIALQVDMTFRGGALLISAHAIKQILSAEIWHTLFMVDDAQADNTFYRLAMAPSLCPLQCLPLFAALRRVIKSEGAFRQLISGRFRDAPDKLPRRRR